MGTHTGQRGSSVIQSRQTVLTQAEQDTTSSPEEVDAALEAWDRPDSSQHGGDDYSPTTEHAADQEWFTSDTLLQLMDELLTALEAPCADGHRPD